jgi:hypothetical protein
MEKLTGSKNKVHNAIAFVVTILVASLICYAIVLCFVFGIK